MEKRDKEIKLFLKKELGSIKPSSSELSQIAVLVDNFLSLIKPELKGKNADIIVGGSFSKDTIIRKDKYDLDFFVRFARQKKPAKPDNQEFADILEKILLNVIKKIKSKPQVKLIRLKGSRDYFNIVLPKTFFSISFEIVPVLKIKNPEEAENVTDLSPFHVTYIKKQIQKHRSLADEIRIVKAFSYAQNCYGAESYIRGFSGYALELLTSYYGSFLNFIKAASKWNDKHKIIIDPLKYYEGKEALEKLNAAKLESPLILIDPTQPERNATAALSKECFNGFISASRHFLSNSSSKFFVPPVIDREKWKKEAKKKRALLIFLNAKSNKKKEDVAGAKLKKFFVLLLNAFRKDLSVLKAEFLFNTGKREADFFFILKKAKEILIKGPPISMPEAVRNFKKKWPKCFAKGRFICTKRKAKSVKEIISGITKDEGQLKEKGIERFSYSLLQ